MKTLLACLFVALCVAAAAAHPESRSRRYAHPARTMMFSGYFRGQHYPHGGGGFRHYVPRNYEPEGAMTAFAAGNTVSAGSFYGNNGGATPDCGQCNGNGNGNGNGHGYGNGNGHGNAIPAGDEPAPSPPEVIPVNGGGVVPEELPAADAPAYPGDQPEAAGVPEQPATEGPTFDAVDPQEPEDAPAPPPVNGNGNGNGKKDGNGNGNGNGKKNGNGNGHANGNGNGKNGNGGKTHPRADDDDYSDEEEDLPALPGKRGRGRGGFYNTYFPMFFGGYPGGRSGQGGETPGVATAIANSFSRGRGAVATSHATAYGGPHLLGGNGSRKAASRRTNGSA